MLNAALNTRVKWAWSAKPAGECGFCQGPRLAQPPPGHVEAPHHRVPVGAGPVDGAELACELVAVQARDRLHLA